MSCSVCVDDFNKSTRKQITCAKCDYSACRSCTVKFLDTASEFKCMNCKENWDYSFVVASLTKKDRTRIEEIYFSRVWELEKSLFEETAERLEHQCFLKFVRSDKFNSTSRKLSVVLQSDLHRCLCCDGLFESKPMKCNQTLCIACIYLMVKGEFIGVNDTTFMCPICDEQHETPEFNFKTSIVKRGIELVLEHDIFPKMFSILMSKLQLMKALDQKHSMPLEFSQMLYHPSDRFKCQQSNCSGTLRNWVCIVCHKPTCKECNVGFEDEHKCKEDDVNSFKEIRLNTRPCPRCKTRIIRSYGCVHMFCTVCFYKFNWNTGVQEVSNRFENPEHSDLLRRIKKSDEDLAQEFNRIQYLDLARDRRTSYYAGDSLVKLCNALLNFYYTGISQLEMAVTPDYEKLRKQFLQSKITETSYKKQVEDNLRISWTAREFFLPLQTKFMVFIEAFINELLTMKSAKQEAGEFENVLAQVRKASPKLYQRIQLNRLHETVHCYSS
jgi:hypothetical protein